MLDLIELTRDECEVLLRTGLVGRVAFTTPTGPHIVPVNYAVIDDAIVIRTSPYSLLGTHGRDSVLAFEVDLVDYSQQHGWSVTSRGRATAVSDPDARKRIRDAWQPRPWAVGARTTLLSIAIGELSGRQLGEGWNALAAMEFRRTPPPSSSDAVQVVAGS